MDKPKFTVKQQRFIDSYDGDIKKAAQVADISYAYARQLMTLKKHAHIVEAIQNREQTKSNNLIMTREQRQEFWTKIVWDVEQSTRDRLKASELMGKSEADFTDKHKLEGEIKSRVNFTMNFRGQEQ